MNTVLKIENISKQYRLGQLGTGTISHDLNRFWAKLRGKEDPYLKVGDTNDRSQAGGSDYVWSLKDINFEVKQGEVLGIIGKNGAGKSTLLKILSQVTTPTTGQVKIKGRIAALLEVGTGFHPDLSGLENIFLNGAILGMTKAEIKSKLDEIVDFSGVAKYLDTPVKRYSSGMMVRLGFAVAAHLEPEILIIDEVLAVGDAEFQKKCLGKMKDVAGQGRTVLFVSHNMGAVQKLCNKGLLLQNGVIKTSGNIEKVINCYMEDTSGSSAEYHFNKINNTDQVAFVTKLSIEDLDGKLVTEIPIGKAWKVIVNFTVNNSVKGLIVGLGMINSFEIPIRTCWNLPQDILPGNYTATFIEEQITFTPGRYRLLVGLSMGSIVIQYLDKEMYMTISDVIENQEDSVLQNTNGILLNQMRMYVEKSN
ncbi:MAG: ABC transporter ATP-binding protein [Bacteroidia bacterium]